MTILTMTFLGLETRNDLPKVTYMTALDYFVAITFAFIFATIVQFAIVHFYTKVGSGEYYIPPIEILEDIKAFHRARQAEKAGYTQDTLNSISDSEENEDDNAADEQRSLSSPSHVLSSSSQNQWQENIDEDNYDNYVSTNNNHDDRDNICNAVVIDGQVNSQVATVASLAADFVTRSREITSLHPDVMHLTSDTRPRSAHRSGGQTLSNISSLCHLREYSSSAPPISINGTLVVPAPVVIDNEARSSALLPTATSIASTTTTVGRRVPPNSGATCSSHPLPILLSNRINSHRLDNQIKSPGVMANEVKSPDDVVRTLAPALDERDIDHQYPRPSAAAAAASSSSSSFCPIHVSLLRYSFN